MPLPAAASLSPRRSSRRLSIPALLLAVLALGWSGFWWYASRRIGTEWDRFIAQQAGMGRAIACDDKRIGGFPFRLELHCGDTTIDSTAPGQIYNARLRGLDAVAQIYQPNKIILEAEGPMVLTAQELTAREQDADALALPKLSLSWTSAQASLSIWTSGPQNASVSIKGLVANFSRGDIAQPLAQNLDLEARMSLAEGADAAPGAYDLFASLQAAALPIADTRLDGNEPVTGEFQGAITRFDLKPAPLPQRLRDWAAQGGTLTIALARLDRGPVSVKAAGALSLDPLGHPQGDLTVALAGVRELGQTMSRSGLVNGRAAGFVGVGLQMLGQPTNIDGKPAVELPVKLANGRASIGAFPVGSLPSLFKP